MPLRAVIGPSVAAGAPGGRLPEALTVLVVDDHEQTRLALADVLSDHGAAVDTAASGTAALERLQALPVERWPRVLLCDITLQDEDGYTVLHAIRRLEAERRVPLAARMPAIALTGHAQAHDRMRALMAGFQQHLVKPVETAELIAAINGVLSSRAAAGGAQR
jgi:ATP-binding cassette subfamily B protein